MFNNWCITYLEISLTISVVDQSLALHTVRSLLPFLTSDLVQKYSKAIAAHTEPTQSLKMSSDQRTVYIALEMSYDR